MAKFDPQKDEDRAYLAAALTAYALGVKLETILSPERGRPIQARAISPSISHMLRLA